MVVGALAYLAGNWGDFFGCALPLANSVMLLVLFFLMKPLSSLWEFLSYQETLRAWPSRVISMRSMMVPFGIKPSLSSAAILSSLRGPGSYCDKMTVVNI